MRVLSFSRDYITVMANAYRNSPRLAGTSMFYPLGILVSQRIWLVLALNSLMQFITGLDLLFSWGVLSVILTIIITIAIFWAGRHYLFKVKHLPENYVGNEEFFQREKGNVWVFIAIYISSFIALWGFMYLYIDVFHRQSLLSFLFGQALLS